MGNISKTEGRHGYDKHQFEYLINGEEAKIVQRIFNEYLAGKTLLQIGNALTEEKVVYYKDRTTWSKQAVRRVHENQHYVGRVGNTLQLLIGTHIKSQCASPWKRWRQRKRQRGSTLSRIPHKVYTMQWESITKEPL